jgi:hypothetical protein
MGNKSSRMAEQLPNENVDNFKYNYKTLGTDEDVESLKKADKIERIKKLREYQEREIDRIAKEREILQQKERYVGQTSVYTSVDNKFQFMVAQNEPDDLFEFKEEQKVSSNEKVPATQFNFYFVRHAKSCANEEKSHLAKVDLDDPFISNDGIWATIAIKDEYDKFFKSKDIDHYFCSVAMRTWCSAGILFREHMYEFQVAPHLRESGEGYTNQPYPYATNVNRFEFFKEYVDVLTRGYVKIYGKPGYGLLNKAVSNYGSDFITDNGLDKFMQWYIKNENALGRNNKSIRNVVVVCHSDLLMNFCQNHLKRPGELETRGMQGGENGFFKKVNNYCIQVQVFMPERTPLPHPTPEMKPDIQQLLDDYKNTTDKTPLTTTDEKTNEIETLLRTYRNPTVQLPAAGGNKHKKTLKRSTKSNKHQFKKTKGRKLRGGSLGRFLSKALFSPQNKYSESLQTNLPLPITIKTVIKGTQSKNEGVERNPSFKENDCICFPDAYKKIEKTFECAYDKGTTDFKEFLERHQKHHSDQQFKILFNRIQ